ncbi:unnamed protein product [Ophioblennius macclurei]
MSPVLNVAFLLCTGLVVSAQTDQLTLVVHALPGEPCTMACTAKQEPGVQYISVRWYKVNGSTRNGLIAKSFPNGTTRYYADVDQRVKLVGASLNISLPRADCETDGEYMCRLSAPVGQQNREGHVKLSVKGCAVELPEDHTTDTYLVIIASAVLIVAFVIFLISYECLKKTLKARNKPLQKEILLKKPLKMLCQQDLKLIYTLGPKPPTPNHLYV